MPAIIQNGHIVGGGEQIDDSTTSVNKVWSSQKVSQSISNPNLVDNPWFTVNQRGASQYTAIGYGVDRWKLHDTNPFTVDVTNTGITLTHPDNSSISWLDQFFEPSIRTLFQTAYTGKKVTMSVMLSDNSIYSATGTIPTFIDTNKQICKVDLPNGYNVQFFGRLTLMAIGINSSTANSSISIRAIKIEFGEISTLALDSAPNYTDELLRCQRYFVRIDNTSGGVTLGNGMTLSVADRAVLCIKLPVSMRTKPSVSGVTNLQCVNGSQTLSVSAISSSSYDNGYETLNVTATGATIGTSYLVRLSNNTQIDFTAEL